MKGLMSLTSERFRTSFMVVYVLSSLIPTLILIFVLLNYVKPILHNDQLMYLTDVATYTLAAMLAVPFLGFLLMSWWINSLEKLTADIKAKTSEILQDRVIITEKNELVTLHRHIDGLYDELQDKITELKSQSEELINSKRKLSRMAVTDELTTLFNRRQFEKRMTSEVKNAEKRKHPLALILLDVNDFKDYNKKFGHAAGDKLLRALGLLIRDYVGKNDLPFRYGGDEFAIILPGRKTEEAAALAQKLVDAAGHLATEDVGKGQTRKASISCGVVSYSKGYAGLMAEADRCLNQALIAGKSKVVCLTPQVGQG